MRIRWLLLAAALGISAAARAEGVDAYRLDVTFLPAEGRLRGVAAVQLAEVPAGLAELTFFLHGELAVEEVTIAGQRREVVQDSVYYYDDYSLVARRVRVPLAGLDPRQGLRIVYSGHFNRSAARSPSDYMRIDASGVFLRSYNYSLWFPVFLDANRDDVVVSFPQVLLRTPAEYVSVFVGTHVGDRLEGQERVSEWRALAVPLSAAQCTAQRFEVLTDGPFHAYSWQDAESRAKGGEILVFARRLEALYRQRYRASAVMDQIHVMLMPRFGDISSYNVVGMTEGIWDGLADDENAKRAFAHELVHPFVSVPTPQADPLWAMAVEGFPSYFHLPVLEELLGEDFYRRYLDWMETLYLQGRQTGADGRGRPLPPEKPLTAIGPAEFGLYKDSFVLGDRSLLVLDYLRRRMGRERFAEFARELTNLPELDLARFRAVVLRYLPEGGEDLRLWLETTEFPDRFRRPPG